MNSRFLKFLRTALIAVFIIVSTQLSYAQHRFSSNILQSFTPAKSISDNEFDYPRIPESFKGPDTSYYEATVSKTLFAFFVLGWKNDRLQSQMIVQVDGKRISLRGGVSDNFLNNIYSGDGMRIEMKKAEYMVEDGAGAYFPRVSLIIAYKGRREKIVVRCLFLEGT